MSGAPRCGRRPGGLSTPLSLTAGRELEIFLDMMASYATDNHSYLLAPAYNRGLSQAEQHLRQQLLALAEQARSEATAEAWGVLDRALADLGYSPNTRVQTEGTVVKVDVRVLTQVSEYLGNYVYMLLDPRTMAPFYVGKGTGTRLAAHGLEAEALSASDEETQAERSRKVARHQ